MYSCTWIVTESLVPATWHTNTPHKRILLPIVRLLPSANSQSNPLPVQSKESCGQISELWGSTKPGSDVSVQRGEMSALGPNGFKAKSAAGQE